MANYNFGKAAPKVQLLQTRVSNTIDLSMEKLALHIKDPSMYPMPADKNSIERLLLDLYNTIPATKRKKFLEKLTPKLNATAAQRNSKYGDLLTVDMKKKTSVVEQVKKISLPASHKFNQTETNDLLKLIPAKERAVKGVVKAGTKTQASTRGLAPRTLSLFLDTVTCNQPQDVRKDEIEMTGFVVDALGNNSVITNFNVGEFKKGEKITLNKKIFDFDLRAAGTFPQLFSAGFTLIDKDWFDAATSQKIQVICGTIAAASSAMILVFAAGMFIAPPGPDAIFVILMFASLGVELLSIAVASIAFAMEDDIFQPALDAFIFNVPPVPPVGTKFDRVLQSVFMKNAKKTNGKYTLNFHWERTA